MAGVGWLSVNATKSLRAFVERVFANFRDKNVVFYDLGKTGNLWVSKDLTHAQTCSLNSNALLVVNICTFLFFNAHTFLRPSFRC